jgi:hypothetical protein
MFVESYGDFQFPDHRFGLDRGPNSLDPMLPVDDLCDAVPDRDRDCAICDLQSLFRINPVQDDAVRIVAAIKRKLLNAVDPSGIK